MFGDGDDDDDDEGDDGKLPLGRYLCKLAQIAQIST